MPNELRYHWNQRQILDSGLENPKKCDLLHRPTPPPVSNQKQEQINRFVCAKPTSFTKCKNSFKPFKLNKVHGQLSYCLLWKPPDPKKNNKTTVFQFNHPAVQQPLVLRFGRFNLGQMGVPSSLEPFEIGLGPNEYPRKKRVYLGLMN